MARDVLTRAERHQQMVRQKEWERERMTPADIGKLMRKVAHEALDRNGVVQDSDFIRANVPKGSVALRGRAIIQEVLDERANGGIHA